jgi:hypothetical protein
MDERKTNLMQLLYIFIVAVGDALHVSGVFAHRQERLKINQQHRYSARCAVGAALAVVVRSVWRPRVKENSLFYYSQVS